MPSVMVYEGDVVQELTSANLNSFYEYILTVYAANSFTGTITFGNSNPIGTFTDTARQGDVGSADITIVSNTYTLSQTTTATLTSTPPAPHIVGLDLTEPGNVILKASSTTITDLADSVLQYRASYRTGGYYLGNTAPSDGGTWQSLGVLKDTIYNFTIENTNYFLWKKLTGNTATLFRPLKIENNTLVEYNNVDIDGILKEVEQRIIATGVGTYALQASTPTPGTWVSRGTITDVRRLVDDNLYTGSDVVVYTNDASSYASDVYAGEYDGAAAYEGVTDSIYTGSALFLTTDYTGGGFYTGVETFLGAPNFYLQNDALAYQSDVLYENLVTPDVYTTESPGVAYTGAAVGYEGTVTGEIGFGVGSSGYDGPAFTRVSLRTANRVNYTGGTYTLTFTGPTRVYLGPGGSFIRFFVGNSFFVGPDYYTMENYTSVSDYLGESSFAYFNIYTGIGGYESSLSFSSFAVFGSDTVYTGLESTYTGLDEAVNYTGTIPELYTGGDIYTGEYTGAPTSYGLVSEYTVSSDSAYTLQTVSSGTEVIDTLTLYERIS